MTAHTSCGFRIVRFASCLLTIATVLLSGDRALAITYNAGPISFSGGHTLSGTIETDGTLGSLTPANILGWNLEVSGPYPFTFTASSSLHLSDVSATATELATTEFFALDETVSGAPCDAASSCEAWLAWDGFAQLVEYRIRDLTLISVPAHEIELTSGSPTLIATAVPEPATLSLALLFLGGLLCGRASYRALGISGSTR